MNGAMASIVTRWGTLYKTSYYTCNFTPEPHHLFTLRLYFPGMASGLKQTITVSPAKKGILTHGRGVLVYLAQNLTKSPYLDVFAPSRISTIIAAAFIKYTDRVEQSFDCLKSGQIPEKIPEPIFDYIINPSILEWCCNLNNSDKAENHIIVQIDILSAESGVLLVSIIINREISWHTEGFNYPCELIIDPLEKIVIDLYY